MKFGVFVYDGVEPVDLATFGVLSMARRVKPEIDICTIAPKKGNVLLSNGLMVHAEHGIEHAPELDVLIVTGGPGWVEQSMNDATLQFVRTCSRNSVVASVCTGAMILAASGLLDGKLATTKRQVIAPEYPPIQHLRETYSSTKVIEGSIVDNGKIITGGGVTLGIDTTLYLLEKLFDAETAAETARIMEYTVARDANRQALPPTIQYTQE